MGKTIRKFYNFRFYFLQIIVFSRFEAGIAESVLFFKCKKISQNFTSLKGVMVIFDWGFMGNMGYFTQRSHNDVPTFQLLDRNPMWLVLNLAYGVIRAFPEEGLASAR